MTWLFILGLSVAPLRSARYIAAGLRLARTRAPKIDGARFTSGTESRIFTWLRDASSVCLRNAIRGVDMTDDSRKLLAGDIGGTKTKLAIFDRKRGLEPLEETTYRSSEYSNLESMAVEFVEKSGTTIDSACFGVAGPVSVGRAKITNLPWTMEEARLAEALGVASVSLINDLLSIATAVPQLTPSQLYTVNEGVPEPGGAIAVVAPGTGLGEAFLVWDGARYHAHPCEGGHTDFAPTNDLECELLAFLGKRYGHVSVERVCSGLGISNVYDFLKSRGEPFEPTWLAEKLARAADRTPIIVNAALEHESELCTATFDLFVEILGREAGNMALKVLATGGVYLAGGIPPRMPEVFSQGRFLECFTWKGRFSEMLSKAPVHVVLEPRIAIMGAAQHGFERMRGE